VLILFLNRDDIMLIRKALIIVAVLLTPLSTALATSGIPDLDNSFWTHSLVEPAGILVCPAGDGTNLGSARSISGGLVDATITLTMLDYSNAPIAYFPAEDMWIEAPGMFPCVGGSIADSETNSSGVATFSNPLMMGGTQNGDLEVFINGMAVNDGESAFHTLLSPDLSGDHHVNLTDTVMFSQAWYSSYDRSIDYFFDGVIDLSDLVLFSEHQGHHCP
jgi:hypothetical protein